MASIKHKICSTYSHLRLCFLQKHLINSRGIPRSLFKWYSLCQGTQWLFMIHSSLMQQQNIHGEKRPVTRSPGHRSPGLWSTHTVPLSKTRNLLNGILCPLMGIKYTNVDMLWWSRKNVLKSSKLVLIINFSHFVAEF